MFPDPAPHVFATPPGVDFSAALVDGLDARLAGHPPEALARVELLVSTARMQRRLTAIYAERGAGFLPRITPVTEVGSRHELAGLPAAMSPLRLRLELAQLIRGLLDREPELAPRAAVYDLADSLAELMGEMQEEGVDPAAVQALDVGDHSGHWARSQRFLSIVGAFFGAAGAGRAVTPEARQAAAVSLLESRWSVAPPPHPVIVAGSTGSRGTTARMMRLVAGLPRGAVVLPGLDPHMPPAVWSRLLEGRRGPGMGGEDHPQYRLGRFLDDIGLAPSAVPPWGGRAPASPARNRLVSLALRPAPVTDQWLREGPALDDPQAAMDAVTLLEAPSPQAEATAIALRLRAAAETGQRAALVSPDRTLARMVTAALDRWAILPDDSAGVPLDRTAPGRLLAQVAEAMAVPPDTGHLLALLKHPLVHGSGQARGAHLLRTRDLELQLLRGRGPQPDPAALEAWAGARKGDPGAVAWAAWIRDLLIAPAGAAEAAPAPLAALVARHIDLAERLSAGVPGTGAGRLWQGEDGQQVQRCMEAVARDAGAGGTMSAGDYRDLIRAILADAQARNPARPRADIMIWGAMEARVQGADLTILAGLNEGTWPAAPSADAWLNRPMRAAAGLRLPDRRIGLSAHDFQQAVAGREVWLTRARRDAESETVPARWLNRLTSLMDGSGPAASAALAQMRARGDLWLGRAAALAAPARAVPRAGRPAPCPPVAARPDSLSVTQIETLIRDPYAIYARKVLGLTALEPLRPDPDARLKGTILHAVLRRFVEEVPDPRAADAEARLLELGGSELDRAVPWPVARALWLSALARGARAFLAGEAERRRHGSPWRLECQDEVAFPEVGLVLRGTADRIDRGVDGSLRIYDYKTGRVPGEKQMAAFAKQLLLEAVMVSKGGFGAGAGDRVSWIEYIGLNAEGERRGQQLEAADIARAEAEFLRLIGDYRRRGQGYVSRRAMFGVTWAGDYDQLARYGEWETTDPPQREEVGG